MNNTTKNIPISACHHRLAKTAASILGMNLKTFVEKCLEEETDKTLGKLKNKK